MLFYFESRDRKHIMYFVVTASLRSCPFFPSLEIILLCSNERRLWTVFVLTLWNGIHSFSWNICIQVRYSCWPETLLQVANACQEKAVEMFSSRILTMAISSQLASGSPWWEWHTNLRMLQVNLTAKRVTIWSLIWNIQVSCLCLPPSYSHWCHVVTRRETRRLLEYSAAHQSCYNGTAQDASCYTTLQPPPFSEKQEVSGLSFFSPANF